LGTQEPATIKQTLGKILDAEKLRYCFDCGICTACCSISDMFGRDYNPRALLEKTVLSPEKALALDQLWMCAWCYRCHDRCPQALKLPEIFLLLRIIATRQGLTRPFENALRRIVETVPLPLVALSVCFHPERAGLDREAVLQKAEKIREKTTRTIKAKTMSENSRVAVLGSGPAGLTVAYELGAKGYGVTVFESLRELGGVLRRYIPDSRLPKKVLAKEIQFLRDLGVNFETSTTVGKDLTFSDLKKKGYKVIFVGAGTFRSPRSKIEGDEFAGVVHALDFLENVNFGEKMGIGRNVVVIGGGNIAMDAARTAMQLGASEVTVLFRRSRDDMPAIPSEVREAEELGVKIELLVSPKRIHGENGRVTSIECSRLQLGELDDTGRRVTTPVEGSDFSRKVDMVILTEGFDLSRKAEMPASTIVETPDTRFLPSELDFNENGNLCVNPITMETNIQGVFAGGDVVTGPATVIEAIRAGKNVAESIDGYLKSLEG
jgi:NADPH-dependent glutamate synthase beta subunit-like oxidoreductase